ncbi:MAG TPA: hypothetical protein VM619_04080 [Luteimonas sp.]|nr:hypothetical protein [Luteimonas sp.]
MIQDHERAGVEAAAHLIDGWYPYRADTPDNAVLEGIIARRLAERLRRVASGEEFTDGR